MIAAVLFIIGERSGESGEAKRSKRVDVFSMLA